MLLPLGIVSRYVVSVLPIIIFTVVCIFHEPPREILLALQRISFRCQLGLHERREAAFRELIPSNASRQV